MRTRWLNSASTPAALFSSFHLKRPLCDSSYSFMPDASPPLPLGAPAGGWLRSTRQHLGLTLQAIADRLDVSPQAVHQFEKSEEAGTISLRQLAAVAAAMGSRVSYQVTSASPRPAPTSARPAERRPASTHTRPAERRLPSKSSTKPAEPTERIVTRSMFLENQESGRFD